jgi:hypothetical protein
MPTPIKVPQRERWDRVRFAIIGPLLAAPPPDGDLQAALAALAAKTWCHPVTGLDIRFGVSTLERWYYAARPPDPVAVLRNRVRADRGAFPSLLPAAREALQAQYRDQHGWSAQRHRDNLRAPLAGTPTPVPSYPTVRRYLKAHGLVRRATPSAIPPGHWRRAIASSSVRWAAARSSMSRPCGTWISTTNRARCSRRPADGSRRFCSASSMTAAPALSSAVVLQRDVRRARAWTVAGVHEVRPAARPDDRQRRADGTVSLAGIRLEIPARYRALETVHLRYARRDLPHVDLIDPHSGVILSPVRPRDKAANAGASRRALAPAAPAPEPSTPAGIAPLLRQLFETHAATGLPPAYLPLKREAGNPLRRHHAT